MRCLVPAEFVAGHADLAAEVGESGAVVSVSQAHVKFQVLLGVDLVDVACAAVVWFLIMQLGLTLCSCFSQPPNNWFVWLHGKCQIIFALHST